MSESASMLRTLGGEAGCQRLSAEFYARVAGDPILRPLFPGKTLRCATEEFAAFLIQFLDGDEEQTQHRWWLSLRESHARFQISPNQRRAWLHKMKATLDATPLDDAARKRLSQFFEHSSAYLLGNETDPPEHDELAERWHEQRVLDDAIAQIAAGNEQQAIALTLRFVPRPAVCVGLLARMIQTGRTGFIRFAVQAVEQNPSLAASRAGGRTLLHYASGAGCLEVVESLLRLGVEPGIEDSGGHTPLYRVANECASEGGPEIVKALVRAGADVNASGGVTRATPLHMAARRGHLETARALLDFGASIEARDSKGDTPLQRALNCRRSAVAQLLAASKSSRS